MKTALGCLGYLALWALLSVAIDEWTAARVASGARPWVGVAAGLQFTLAAGALWTAVSGLLRRGGSRAAILERATAGTVPDEDGPVLVTGTVRAATQPLRAPISGTPCVAYTYRMFFETRNHKGRREEVPVYWGLASRPFIVDTRARAVRVMAVPWIVDEAARRSGADMVLRARQYIATTRFEEATGLLGALGTAVSTVRVLFTDDDGEHRADYKSTGTERDPGALLLEETLLPVGASASVAGTWLASQGAMQTASGAGGGVQVTTGDVQTLLKGSSQVPASTTSSLVFAIVLGSLGAALLWAAVTWLGPGSPYVPR